MSDELDPLLRRAGRALRDQAAADHSPLPGGRSRILARIDADKRAAARRVAIAVPLLVIGITSTAIAAASGVLPKVFEAVRAAVSGPLSAPSPDAAVQPPVPAPPRVGTKAAPRLQAPPPVDLLAEAQVADTPPQPVAPEPTPEPAAAPVPQKPVDRRPAAVRPGLAAPPPTAPPPAAVAPPPAPEVPAIAKPTPLALFRAAQRLQFDRKDWSAALQAWQTYLDEEPHGALEPEARWNRALCLVRLGRKPAARDALAPFAAGAFGGYQQARAAELLANLADHAP